MTEYFIQDREKQESTPDTPEDIENKRYVLVKKEPNGDIENLTYSNDKEELEETKEYELISYYRGIAIDEGIKHPSVLADRYAKFMAEYKENVSNERARTLANDFKNGDIWHKLTPEDKKNLIIKMTESSHGTAKEFKTKTLRKALNEVEQK